MSIFQFQTGLNSHFPQSPFYTSLYWLFLYFQRQTKRQNSSMIKRKHKLVNNHRIFLFRLISISLSSSRHQRSLRGLYIQTQSQMLLLDFIKFISLYSLTQIQCFQGMRHGREIEHYPYKHKGKNIQDEEGEICGP